MFALQGCCSRLESLAIDGVNHLPSHREMIATLKHEIPKIQLAVASVGMRIICTVMILSLFVYLRLEVIVVCYMLTGKPWHTVANLEGSDIVQSRQVRFFFKYLLSRASFLLEYYI